MALALSMVAMGYLVTWMFDAGIHKYIVAATICILSCIFSYLVFLRKSFYAWLLVKSHINVKSVENRLEEINA